MARLDTAAALVCPDAAVSAATDPVDEVLTLTGARARTW
jgi:hypothetical protein